MILPDLRNPRQMQGFWHEILVQVEVLLKDYLHSNRSLLYVSHALWALGGDTTVVPNKKLFILA